MIAPTPSNPVFQKLLKALQKRSRGLLELLRVQGVFHDRSEAFQGDPNGCQWRSGVFPSDLGGFSGVSGNVSLISSETLNSLKLFENFLKLLRLWQSSSGEQELASNSAICW